MTRARLAAEAQARIEVDALQARIREMEEFVEKADAGRWVCLRCSSFMHAAVFVLVKSRRTSGDGRICGECRRWQVRAVEQADSWGWAWVAAACTLGVQGRDGGGGRTSIPLDFARRKQHACLWACVGYPRSVAAVAQSK